MSTNMIDKLPDIGAVEELVKTENGNYEMRYNPNGKRLRFTWDHFKEDFALWSTGRLDTQSFVSGYERVHNPTEMILFNVYEAAKMGYRFEEYINEKGEKCFNHIDNIREAKWRPLWHKVIRQHNTRTTPGRDQWQRLQLCGDNSVGYFSTITGTASTSPTSTTLTNSSASFPTAGGIQNTAGLRGHAVYVGGVWGNIMSNTSTVLTVDQWYNPASSTGAAGSTPSNGATYLISPVGGPALWVGISTNSATPSAGDVVRSADGLFADGTSSGSATEQTSNGLARQYTLPSYSTAGEIILTPTFTYTGSGSVTIYKGVLCNSLAAAGSILWLETLMNASATVSTNGDAIALTWTITL